MKTPKCVRELGRGRRSRINHAAPTAQNILVGHTLCGKVISEQARAFHRPSLVTCSRCRRLLPK